MSLNIVPLPVSGCLDARLEIRDHQYISMRGAAVSSYTTFPANNLSTSSVTCTCNPPSREMAISRLVFQRASFLINLAGTNDTDGPLLVDGRHGPRGMPLTMVTDSMQITLNNVVATQSPLQQYWGALMWLGENNHAQRFGQYSLTASMLDQTQSYAESFASNRSPLAPYIDNSFENTRAGFVGYEIVDNKDGATTAQVRLRMVEPILVSPFVAGHSSNFTSCITGIQNCSVQLNFGNLRRLLSIDNTAPGINIDVNSINVAMEEYSLIFNYFTMDPLMSIPRNITASYFNITPHSGPDGESLAPGGVRSFPFNAIQLSNIPKLKIWGEQVAAA